MSLPYSVVTALFSSAQNAFAALTEAMRTNGTASFAVGRHAGRAHRVRPYDCGPARSHRPGHH